MESLLGLGAAVAASLPALLPSCGPHEWLVRGGASARASSGVALTFDDGPHPDRTPRILDLLGAAGARATFFFVGRRAAASPGVVRRAAAEGHEVANHSWSHAWMPGLSSEDIASELASCQDTLASIVGFAPRLVRPPYGHRDLRFNLAARSLGLTPVLWSVDTLDYLGFGAAAVLRRARRARRGDVVLMHDGNPRARGTIEALVPLLRLLYEAGLRPAPLARTGPERMERLAWNS